MPGRHATFRLRVGVRACLEEHLGEVGLLVGRGADAATSRWPFATAPPRADAPLASCSSIRAPSSQSRRTSARSPPLAARLKLRYRIGLPSLGRPRRRTLSAITSASHEGIPTRRPRVAGHRPPRFKRATSNAFNDGYSSAGTSTSGCASTPCGSTRTRPLGSAVILRPSSRPIARSWRFIAHPRRSRGARASPVAAPARYRPPVLATRAPSAARDRCSPHAPLRPAATPCS